MTAPTPIRQKAITLIEQLPEAQLILAVELLEALSNKTKQHTEVASSSPQEEALLQIIQRRLPPNEQARLNYLRQRNEAGDITDAEHQELLIYVERIEQQDAERAAALIQLAQLWKVDIKTLVNEFLPIHHAV